MRNLPKPTIRYSDHYDLCVQVGSASLKTRLENIFPILEEVGDEYDRLASRGEVYQIERVDEAEFLPVIPDNLKKLYTQQMSKKGRPARATYDILMIAAKRRCPFCSHHQPKTLDHYLPKGDGNFPEFSVFPLNLVPCCRDCNHKKFEDVPDTEAEQYIHPYYDDISDIQWLEAQVDFSLGAPTITYFINEDAEDLSVSLYERLHNQFTSLELNQLYSIEAGDELSGIEYSLRDVFGADGAAGIREHLLSQAKSRSRSNRNSWQAAMYRCLSESDEFCEMGWTL